MKVAVLADTTIGLLDIADGCLISARVVTVDD